MLAQIDKWEITYSGVRSESFFHFIERVESKAASRQVDYSALFKGAGDPFTGSAYTWFSSNLVRGQFND